MPRVKGLKHDKTEDGYPVKTEDGEFLMLGGEYTHSYEEVEVSEDLIVENSKPLYDFPEIDKVLVTKEQLLEFVYRRGWQNPEDFDLSEFVKFYQGMVKQNAASN